eukprot:1694844-Alexandrium_andersonii.AAC.1
MQVVASSSEVSLGQHAPVQKLIHATRRLTLGALTGHKAVRRFKRCARATAPLPPMASQAMSACA